MTIVIRDVAGGISENLFCQRMIILLICFAIRSISKQTFVLRSSTDLMTRLVCTPSLFTFPSEFTIYVILKLWLYVKLHPASSPFTTSKQDMFKEIQGYYHSREG